jgi:Zn-dependent protease with chaperone function
MNFFEHQAEARKSSKRLVLLFALAVTATVLAVGLVVMVAADRVGSHGYHAYSPRMLYLLHPTAFYLSSLVTLAVIGLGTMYKTMSLRSGGGAVAREFGATLVEGTTRNFAHRRLRNVVEEIAIASGVPVPEIYVLEHEPGLNAFAAGFTPADAAIAVTQGCLDRLTRDELQGVIAHEFSHVLNGDMRINIRLMGTLFGILLIALAGQKVIENARGSSKDGWPIFAIALSLMIIGYVGLFFGRLIKAGVSRQREFLADASAVQFTRQASGIAGALKKIGALEVGSKLEAKESAEEVSHMLFGDGVGYSQLFATHPPLEQRIKRIEPRFDPRELEEIARRWGPATQAPPDRGDGYEQGAEVSLSGFAPLGAGGAPKASARATPAPSSGAKVSAQAAAVRSHIGTTDDEAVRQAQGLGAAIPESLRTSAYMQERAPALLLALALDSDAGVRGRQLDLIGSQYAPEQRAVAESLYQELALIDPMLRLPLAALAFPALRRQPRTQLVRLVACIDRVIRADEHVDLREYCLAALVTQLVREVMDPSRAKLMGRRKLAECRNECAQLLAIVAHAGNDGPDAARHAYLDGAAQALGQTAPAYREPEDWQAELEHALSALDQLEPTSKSLMVEALTRTIGHDGRMTLAESELLRTVCGRLHCPLPPLLAQQAA